jgi:hypothetical protein
MVEIVLAKDNFGKKLQFGLENIAGKGKQFLGIDVSDVQSKYIDRAKAQN